jgi:hypothetical protein
VRDPVRQTVALERTLRLDILCLASSQFNRRSLKSKGNSFPHRYAQQDGLTYMHLLGYKSLDFYSLPFSASFEIRAEDFALMILRE